MSNLRRFRRQEHHEHREEIEDTGWPEGGGRSFGRLLSPRPFAPISEQKLKRLRAKPWTLKLLLVLCFAPLLVFVIRELVWVLVQLFH